MKRDGHSQATASISARAAVAFEGVIRLRRYRTACASAQWTMPGQCEHKALKPAVTASRKTAEPEKTAPPMLEKPWIVAAKLFLRLALSGAGGIRPRVINVDGHPAYARAIAELKRSGDLSRRCRCRPLPYLNNVIEQDHRFIKKRIAASLWFRSAEGALRTIKGYEAIHLIRKGQIRWLPKGDVVGQVRFIQTMFGITA